MKNVLVHVMAKAAEVGLCKTRLAKHVGHTRAASLQEQLLLDCHFTLSKIHWPYRVWLYSNTHKPSHPFQEDHVSIIDTPSLGKAMQMAYANDVYRQVFVGVDSPWIMPTAIEQALHALNQHDAVLGPCLDGGIYVLGLTKPIDFMTIPWGTEYVFQSLTQQLQTLRTFNLKMDRDLDEIEDLRWFQSSQHRQLLSYRLIEHWNLT